MLTTGNNYSKYAILYYIDIYIHMLAVSRNMVYNISLYIYVSTRGFARGGQTEDKWLGSAT